MIKFILDPDLHQRLKQVREEVRDLFERLRLRHENGDRSGKDRLERVPALAKRNFGYLQSGGDTPAVKQAWRLVDFLEGAEAAKLSPLAREALRTVELDSQMAILRASPLWRESAIRLREALGAASDADPVPSGRGDSAGMLLDPGEAAGVGKPSLPDALAESPKRARTPLRVHAHAVLVRPWIRAGVGVATVVLLGSTAVLWSAGEGDGARYSCLPLEKASPRELAAHWALHESNPLPVPAANSAPPSRAEITISDSPGGEGVRSIFTTSQFSYEERKAPDRPGGGRADVRLRVGGWGDTYLSLLKVPLPDNRLARRATIRLVVLGDEPGSRPTPMTLRTVAEPWDVPVNPDSRLWWKDCPRSSVSRRDLPAPGPAETNYDIDITDIYNRWARGFTQNNGIMFEPNNIGSHGPDVAKYANFSTFYSTRAIDPRKRPKIIVDY